MCRVANTRPAHRAQFDEPLPRSAIKRLQKQLQKYYKAVSAIKAFLLSATPIFCVIFRSTQQYHNTFSTHAHTIQTNKQTNKQKFSQTQSARKCKIDPSNTTH